jgi:hypothetical protein
MEKRSELFYTHRLCLLCLSASDSKNGLGYVLSGLAVIENTNGLTECKMLHFESDET